MTLFSVTFSFRTARGTERTETHALRAETAEAALLCARARWRKQWGLGGKILSETVA